MTPQARDTPPRSQCDFVGDVSAPISLRVLTNFLGVPDEYMDRFYRWTNQIMRFGEPDSFNLLRARHRTHRVFSLRFHESPQSMPR